MKTYPLTKLLTFPSLSAFLGANLALTPITLPAAAQTTPVSSVGNGVTFTCNDTEATIRAKNGPRVTFGTTSIYIGYQQVSSSNKDPRIIRFDSGVRKWCRSDYENTGDDGTGYGLIWNGSTASTGVLYGIFSSTGTQIGPNFTRFTSGRWLPGYGTGGGPKVAIIARIDPTNGNIQYATYLSARKTSDGKTNSLAVKGLSWNGTTLTVQADSFFSPRRVDTSSMICTGSSPFKYTIVFTGDLTKANSAQVTKTTTNSCQ
ncbi:hypothetical protein B6N60_01034 [Richelia sinica FACHB-800]|uniref:Uncharacterized protein n=1 Tax=Richelia sinica FACHB-800 TaxID=1357546 RepID=A0A975Y3P3_9NOST|nr:hypothetical protein [Richelia sinica]MBD2664897.1 hypothetical protein [Richelia sinica FACHB-800]QXE22351.1 hypothetical protein B6N60_01034 [Richelia sinica FACHB-800]